MLFILWTLYNYILVTCSTLTELQSCSAARTCDRHVETLILSFSRKLKHKLPYYFNDEKKCKLCDTWTLARTHPHARRPSLGVDQEEYSSRHLNRHSKFRASKQGKKIQTEPCQTQCTETPFPGGPEQISFDVSHGLHDYGTKQEAKWQKDVHCAHTCAWQVTIFLLVDVAGGQPTEINLCLSILWRDARALLYNQWLQKEY